MHSRSSGGAGFLNHQQYLIGVSWDWYNYLHLVWIFLLVIKLVGRLDPGFKLLHTSANSK